MAQYIYTMNRVSKVVPPKREILKDISLSFWRWRWRWVKPFYRCGGITDVTRLLCASRFPPRG